MGQAGNKLPLNATKGEVQRLHKIGGMRDVEN
ncbi:hypothetical protein LCGC14_0728270 [marine sediment metagenome]|uniref:Uncharacterized protein n=1 Tax=marine sediment metagenome TaxID=412755 RepID=A0A0F9QVD8_9ZZZZ